MAGSFAETARWKLRRLLGTSKVSDVDEGFQRLAEDVDTTMVGLSVDTFAKRPAAGIPNRLFRASDTGALYVDDGTIWRMLAITSWASVTSAAAVSFGSGDFTVSKLATGEYEVKYTTQRTVEPVVVATGTGSAGMTVNVFALSKTGFKLQTVLSGNKVDASFNFAVIGGA